MQELWTELSSPQASPFAEAAQRALADRPGSGSRVYRTATSPAASMSSYSSAAVELEAVSAGGALNSPGQDVSSRSTAATRASSRAAAGSRSPSKSPNLGRDASSGSGPTTRTLPRSAAGSQPGSSAAAAPSPQGGCFASPFEAEVQRRKTASEPSSPLDSPHVGSPHAADRARSSLVSPAVRQVLSFESASTLAALP